MGFFKTAIEMARLLFGEPEPPSRDPGAPEKTIEQAEAAGARGAHLEQRQLEEKAVEELYMRDDERYNPNPSHGAPPNDDRDGGSSFHSPPDHSHDHGHSSHSGGSVADHSMGHHSDYGSSSSSDGSGGFGTFT